MNDTDIISRADGLAQRLFEGRMLVITANDSMLHRFNEVGTFVWGLLEKPETAGEICAAVEEHFDGFDGKTGTADIKQFLSRLQEKELIKIKGNEKK